MPPDFLALARDSLAFLEREYDFQVGDVNIADSFDNASVEFRSPAWRVEAIRERGIVWIELGPPLGVPAHWFSLDLVLEYLGESAEAARLLSGGREFGKEATALRHHYCKIAPLFGLDRYAETTTRLTQLAEARAAERFGPISP